MRTLRVAGLGLLALMLALPASAAAKTFVVTKTADTNDGHCNSDCSLREAVSAANDTTAGDTVKLKAKTYKLTIEGTHSDNSAGSLNVSNDLRIVGAGRSKTVIEGAWATTPDGLIAMESGPDLTVSGMTLRGGDTLGLGQGAAIDVGVDSTLRIDHARLTRGTSDTEGAIANYGRAIVSHVIFDHNHANCCAGFYNEGGSKAKLTNVTFDHNTAQNDTGAMYSSGIRATLRNVTFSGNRAGSVGGALITSNEVLNMTNVTFSGNKSTDDGGGLYIEGGTTNNLNNVTFTRNVADSDNAGGGNGGGLYNASGGSASVNVQNTIIAANTDTGGEAPDCSQFSGDAFTSLGHNAIGPGPAGCTFTLGPGDLVGVESTIGLAPLADNGGFTQTVALKKSSVAVNHGSKQTPGSGGPACDKHDQRGVKRPQGKRCDIGAYERKP
jgi:CSLREA domain-containing protein